MISWTTWAALPVLLITAWLYTVSVTKTRFPLFRNKKICLLIAHPDDEAMFFAPTVLALTEASLGNHVKILCLSSGNADGLGETRKKELVKSGMLLGLRQEEDVFIIDSPEFPDSMTETWPKEKIAQLLTSAFTPQVSSTKPAHTTSASTSPATRPPSSKPSSSNSAPTATIDILITFDSHGISAHPNHISLYHGARHFLSLLTRKHPGWQSPVDLYTLPSRALVRKYSGLLDTLTSLLAVAFAPRRAGAHPSPLLFLSSPTEVRRAQQAMTQAHKSQMRWFRWGWIVLSRYMYVNELDLERVA